MEHSASDNRELAALSSREFLLAAARPFLYVVAPRPFARRPRARLTGIDSCASFGATASSAWSMMVLAARRLTSRRDIARNIAEEAAALARENLAWRPKRPVATPIR